MDAETAKALNALSNKMNDIAQKIDEYFGIRVAENQQGVADAQNAACDLSIDVEERIADVENALCELSEMEI